MRRALGEARSPVGVPPRLLPGGFRPFRSAPGQSSWDAAARRICRAGVTRLRLSQSRESTSRSGRSTAAHDAQSCSGAVASPRGSTDLAPRSGSHPKCALLDERDSRPTVADLGTIVKDRHDIGDRFGRTDIVPPGPTDSARSRRPDGSAGIARCQFMARNGLGRVAPWTLVLSIACFRGLT